MKLPHIFASMLLSGAIAASLGSCGWSPGTSHDPSVQQYRTNYTGKQIADYENAYRRGLIPEQEYRRRSGSLPYRYYH